jgi:hypothetical protein
MLLTQISTTALRALLVVVFAAAVLGKLRTGSDGMAEFTRWVGSLRVLPSSLSRPAAYATPAIEAGIAVLLLLPWTQTAGFACAAALLAAFALATWAVHRRGIRAACRCFGQSTAVLGPRHVARDTLLTLAALGGLAFRTLGALPGPSTAPALALGLAAGVLLALGVLFLDDITALFDLG